MNHSSVHTDELPSIRGVPIRRQRLRPLALRFRRYLVCTAHVLELGRGKGCDGPSWVEYHGYRESGLLVNVEGGK